MSNPYFNADGNPLTLSRGSSSTVRTEFSNIEAGFDGVNTAIIAETTRAEAAEILLAPLASPALTGTPTAPTATAGANTTQLATTAFSAAAIAIETTRAEAAEAAEIARAEAAEAAEIARAEAAEAAEIARAEAAEAAEIARAEAAEALLAPRASPTFTGTVTIPAGASIAGYAALAGAAFTGAVTVQAPTASGNPTTKSYVDASIFAGGSAPEWVSGNTYTLGNVTFSPLNFQTYRHITASSSLATDPSLDATNWSLLGGIIADAVGWHATGGTVPATLTVDASIKASDIIAGVYAGQEIITPTNSSPADASTGVLGTPTLTGSTFYSNYGATQSAIQVQVSTSSSFTSPLYSSGDQAAGTSFTLPSGILSTGTVYYWRARYKNSRGTYSLWSAPTSFTTAAAFNNYIATPTATPAFGSALEGGFYTGLIWNELVESAASITIGTGSMVFSVPDMTSAPIVYAGQALEVRSRANPFNNMVGTVTGAIGTTLTINVTSVGGSGTFSDWSIMSKYRIIVSPKATGETLLAVKNANTAMPAACDTLTEGRKATLAMVAADTSTVYPAAWFCNGLTIGGYTDWYLPARDELELTWRNLKPTVDANYATADRPVGATANYAVLGSYGDTAATHGTNNNSSPTGTAYTTGVPAQTAATAFQTGGAEAFAYGSAVYWSASEYSATNAWYLYCGSSNPGGQYDGSKTPAYQVRAVRRSII